MSLCHIQDLKLPQDLVQCHTKTLETLHVNMSFIRNLFKSHFKAYRTIALASEVLFYRSIMVPCKHYLINLHTHVYNHHSIRVELMQENNNNI